MKSRIRSFGEVHFGNAKLGDARRTRRLVRTADLMSRRPGGTLPQKLNNPNDLRAFYRLMDCDQVTHEALLDSHREATFERISETPGTVLILHDATHIDLTTHQSLEDLGQIGNGKNRGYVAQNSLAVDPATRQVLGLCHQVLHRRVKVRGNETVAQKRKRASRESLLWLKGTEPLPSSQQLVDVCDRGADTFEFLEQEVHSGRRFVIRAAYDRGIFIGHGDPATSEASHLMAYAAQLPERGRWIMSVTSKVEVRSPKKKGKKAIIQRTKRNAEMAVAFAPVQIKPPSTRNGNHGHKPLAMWVVRVWEIDPPEGQERLEWLLLTNEPVLTFEDAYRVVGWYECRWIIEVYQPQCTSSAVLYQLAA